MQNHSTDYRINDKVQNIGNLWQAIADLANKKVSENSKSSEYDRDSSEKQSHEISDILEKIDITHRKMLLTFLDGDQIKVKRLTFNSDPTKSRYSKKDFYIATKTGGSYFTPSFDVVDDFGKTRPITLGKDFTSTTWKMIP